MGGSIGGSWDLERVATAFSHAATDPARWPEAMEIAANITGSYGAALFPFRGRLPDMPLSRSLAASFETYVKDGWIHNDERYRAAGALVSRGVATEFDFTTPDEIARHPYYQEFLAPHRLRWFAGIKLAFDDDLWCLSIQRSVEQGPFMGEEINRLKQLSMGLGSAAALARALNFARLDAALAAFEVSGSAVVLLDRMARVIRVNSAAERLLRGDPSIKRGRLVSSDREATASLNKALHALLWAETRTPVRPVALPRSGQRPVMAYPVRLPAVTADALASCQAVIVLADLEHKRRPAEAALQSAFGLTAAESRLAARLATGEAVESISKSLGIAKETARKHLASIFAKTGAHRQAELVAVVVSLLSQTVGGT